MPIESQSAKSGIQLLRATIYLFSRIKRNGVGSFLLSVIYYLLNLSSWIEQDNYYVHYTT